MIKLDSIWEDMGQTVVPLFEHLKKPMWEGWSSDDPEKAAIAYIQKVRPGPVTGAFLRMRGCGVVIDCEGRKWCDTEVPTWMRNIRTLASGNRLPSWISAGGDGGQGIRNILLPYTYTDICNALGIAESAGRDHVIPLGCELKAELLLKHGVCIPYSSVRPDGEPEPVAVDWADDAPGGLEDARDRARSVMSNVIDELRVALSAARAKLNAIAAATGSDPKLIRNFGSSAPASPLVEKALFTGGYAAGLTATQIALAAGESRHYIACTWASWAWTVELPRIRARIGDDSSGEMFVNRVIDTITKRISEDWATEAGFSEREVRKSVGEEIGFFCRQGMIA